MNHMQRILITIGIICLATGILWPWLAKLGLGRLPGDIHVERGNWSFHFPLTTSILLSIVLTLVLALLSRR